MVMALRPNLEHNPRGDQPLSRWETKRCLVEADGASHVWTFYPVIGIGLSFFVGYFSSFLGIGGGIIHVPALVWFLHFPVHIATATSHFILAIMALAGTLVHVWTGALAQGWQETLGLAWACSWGRNWAPTFPSGSRAPGLSAAWPSPWGW